MEINDNTDKEFSGSVALAYHTGMQVYPENSGLAPEGALFSTSAISLHLLQLGYPKKSVDSMLKCGTLTGQRILVNCGCSTKLVDLKHHCNLRTCDICSNFRKKRIRKQFFPFLSSLAQNRKYFLYFLTISPKNYDNLSYGLKDIRKNFNKFLRHKYIKDRVKAGLYVIEAKKKRP